MKPTEVSEPSASVISRRRRLAAAYADLAEVRWQNSGSVKAGNNSYGFIPISSILEEVRRVKAKHGILVIFSAVRYAVDQGEKRITQVSHGQYGETTWQVANGHYDVEIVNSDDPEDVMSLTVSCEAKDNSDKLDNKLLTNAMRSLYRSIFDIDEGSEDPESVNIPTTDEVKPTPRTASSDAFFGSAKKKAAPTLTPSQAVGADRSIEERRELIAKWSKLASMDAIWADLRDENGPDPGAWTDQQVREAYARMVAVGRAAKEGQ
ncbi:MAG: ERF family protein [Sphaerochaetaceae bacterium]